MWLFECGTEIEVEHVCKASSYQDRHGRPSSFNDLSEFVLEHIDGRVRGTLVAKYDHIDICQLFLFERLRIIRQIDVIIVDSKHVMGFRVIAEFALTFTTARPRAAVGVELMVIEYVIDVVMSDHIIGHVSLEEASHERVYQTGLATYGRTDNQALEKFQLKF